MVVAKVIPACDKSILCLLPNIRVIGAVAIRIATRTGPQFNFRRRGVSASGTRRGKWQTKIKADEAVNQPVARAVANRVDNPAMTEKAAAKKQVAVEVRKVA